jgi:hypothetical protein
MDRREHTGVSAQLPIRLKRMVAHIALRFLTWMRNSILACRRFPNSRVGATSFHGPERFLKLCAQSASMLEATDPALFHRITNEPFVFWYDPKRLLAFGRNFSINEGYCAWGDIGITAFLVFALNKVEACEGRTFPELSRSDIRARYLLALERTRTWLNQNCFPPELIAYYS